MKRWSRTTGTPSYVSRLQRQLLTLPAIGSPWVLLVTGSREAEREVWGNVISDVLDEINIWLDRIPNLSGAGVRIPRAKILRHGRAPGIDLLAHARARSFGYTPDPMPADWRHWGRRSGIIRNQQMIDKYPRPHLCVAFFAQMSSGTAQCAGQARAAGIPTMSISVEDLYLPHAS